MTKSAAEKRLSNRLAQRNFRARQQSRIEHMRNNSKEMDVRNQVLLTENQELHTKINLLQDKIKGLQHELEGYKEVYANPAKDSEALKNSWNSEQEITIDPVYSQSPQLPSLLSQQDQDISALGSDYLWPREFII